MDSRERLQLVLLLILVLLLLLLRLLLLLLLLLRLLFPRFSPCLFDLYLDLCWSYDVLIIPSWVARAAVQRMSSRPPCSRGRHGRPFNG